MIRLSGLKVKDDLNPNGDIEIKLEMRAGEKLYEELLIGDNVSKTENPLIMRAKEDMINWDDLKVLLDKIKDECNNSDHLNLRKTLIELVPDFIPQSNISDILYESEIEK